MARFEIEIPEGVPADVEVRCRDHGTTETYPQHRSTLPFYCPDCSLDLTIDVADADDWRELTERC